MAGKLGILLMAILFMGCANPRYITDSNKDSVAESASSEFVFPASQICVNLVWERKPTETEMGSFLLEFHGCGDSSQFVELIYDLEVKLWMPSMGHGSRPTTVEKLGMGQYRVSQVFFLMRGAWELQVQLKNGSQIIEQAVHPVRF